MLTSSGDIGLISVEEGSDAEVCDTFLRNMQCVDSVSLRWLVPLRMGLSVQNGALMSRS